ncbi:MAG: hypothetical protein Q3990_05150 [Desulfovibrionaceae bacterium]|nr:hypothetical protein [Desulfovibrionaceae bacterium]
MKRTSLIIRTLHGFCCAALCLLLAAGSLSCTAPKHHGRKDAQNAALLLSPDRNHAEQEGGRISPVYEQWLFKQSMLAFAEKATSELSGSRLLWRHSGASKDKSLVNRAAPTWLVVNMAQRGTTLSSLAKDLPAIAARGIGGIWLDGVMESDAAWTPETAVHSYRQAGIQTAKTAGAEEDLKALVQAMQAASLQCGMDTVPMATGFGPDFMLQARGSLAQRGMYVTAEIPADFQAMLPEAERPWDCKILPGETCQKLLEKGILPGPLRQETMKDANTFWAVTGPVLGTDGRTRRIAYRVLDTVWNPLLCWQDPGNAARKTLAGAIISVTGMRRQTLAGLSVRGLAGLDVAAPGQGSVQGTGKNSAEEDRFPADTALLDMTQQIHRYGGWSLVRSGHDLSQAACLAAGDFFYATDVEKGLAEALAGGSTTSLASALSALKSAKIPLSNMVFSAPEKLPQAQAAGTAASAAGTSYLAQALPAGLPGLFFMRSGADYADTNADKNAAYGNGADDIFLPVLKARAELDVSEGTLQKVLTPAEGVLVTVVKLPGNGYLITALNFSFSKKTCSVPLPGGSNSDSLLSLTRGAEASFPAASQLAISLSPRQAAHFLTGSSLGGIR